MESQKILPLKNRLDKFQLLELEGFTAKRCYTEKLQTSFLSEVDKNELLLKYHKALEKSEKELKELQEEILDKIIDIKSNIDEEFKNITQELQ